MVHSIHTLAIFTTAILRRMSCKQFFFALFLGVLLVSPQFSNSQQLNIPVGGWRDHLPMNLGISVTQTPEKVYAATDRGLIVLQKEDNSFEALTKAKGLSDLSLSAIGYHEETETVVIGYRNGNIDFIRKNEIVNMADIKRTPLVAGPKQIYSIKFKGDDAYLCTSFGLVVIDMQRREIRATIYPTQAQAEVYDVDFNADTIAVGTRLGSYFADINNPALVYYGAWQAFEGFGSGRIIKSVCHFDNTWYFNKIVPFESNRDTIFSYRNGETEIVQTNGNFFNLRSNNGVLFLVKNTELFYKTTTDTAFRSFSLYDFNVQAYPVDAIADSEDPGKFWIADQVQGLSAFFTESHKPWFTPEGPYSKNTFRMAFSGGQLWVSTGAYDFGYNPIYIADGLLNRDGPFWRSFRYPFGSDYIRDFTSVAIDPYDSKHVFATTWGYGMIELQDGAIVQRYDTANSGMDAISPLTAEIRASSLAFDKDGKLWTLSTSAVHPIGMRKPDGTWRSYSFGPSIDDQSTGDLMVDSSGNKWFMLAEKGLVVFSTDEEDNLVSYKLLNDQVGRGALNSVRVYSMAQDLDGQVWVGTDKGVCVFYSPDAILQEGSENWDAQKITISQGGFNQYLLNSEEVTAIVVDGANRKWFGTRKAGLFLVSPDGTEQIEHFTFENSPLLSNSINTMCMDQETGELYIGTDQGICSFRTDATLGGKTFGKVYAFPNPVRPEYNGPVTIAGLVANAEVRITDVEGNVVFSGRANGGTITWNGRLYSGERAATGVYLIFASNDDGSQTKVAKLLFVN
jgi:hypothetical protein